MTCNCTHHCETREFFYDSLKERDPEIARLIQNELWRQQDHIELIASENIVSEAVLQAQGSVLTNKYAEGYSGHRYYHGCEFIDGVETLAIERAKKLFNCAFANVQPHSGSQANQAVYMALLQPGDTIMGMSLDAGGHLTHGAKVSASGKLYHSVQYGVTDKGLIDYDALEKLAVENKPKLIVAGGSAYARIIDFNRFRSIADKVGAYLMVDMAHFAGLVAGNQYPSPLPVADVVTTTTHKTLRGPRGGMILTNNPDIAKKINSAVFPGIQGGPLEHVIAGKAVAFGEALKPEFSEYAEQIVQNSKALEKTLKERDIDMVTGGTDTHLILIDLRSKGLKGNEVCDSLARANIICNKNAVPNDPEKPSITSGLRIGTPAGTTRGFGIHEFEDIADMIADIIDGVKLTNGQNEVMENVVREKVLEMCQAFPIYPNK
ncbi:MAG: serine hydroxymethyltransferase [Alphaproteobacteria bacterium]|nr:serine hydroxymethyltransferase [Alphaproteobacteria bacterium]